MKITTDEFSLRKKDYFKILVTNALHNYWFVFILFFLVSAIGTKMTTVSIVSHFIFFLSVSVLYLLYLVIYSAIRSWLLRGNQFMFSPRRCEIDPGFIAVCFVDGSLSKINFSHITKMVVRKNYFLFYYWRNQLIYIPLKAINNPTDVQTLLTWIKVKSA